MKKKYGINRSNLGVTEIAALTSIEGFLGACHIRAGEIASSPRQFYALINSVYGIEPDRSLSFGRNVVNIQNIIANFPREVRKALHEQVKWKKDVIARSVGAETGKVFEHEANSEGVSDCQVLAPKGYGRKHLAVEAVGEDWSLPVISRRRITQEEIDSAVTENGGFTRRTLAVWGVPWPPMNGWRKALLQHGVPLFEIDMSSKNKMKRSSDAALACLKSNLGNRPPVKKDMQAASLLPNSLSDYVGAAVPSAVKKEFYRSWEWRTLRMEVLKERGRRCECCGSSPTDVDMAGKPVKICVDHIKSLSKHWHLRLEKTNLQILCDECNQGKGAWDETDWREGVPSH